MDERKSYKCGTTKEWINNDSVIEAKTLKKASATCWVLLNGHLCIWKPYRGSEQRHRADIPADYTESWYWMTLRPVSTTTEALSHSSVPLTPHTEQLHFITQRALTLHCEQPWCVIVPKCTEQISAKESITITIAHQTSAHNVSQAVLLQT